MGSIFLLHSNLIAILYWVFMFLEDNVICLAGCYIFVFFTALKSFWVVWPEIWQSIWYLWWYTQCLLCCEVCHMLRECCFNTQLCDLSVPCFSVSQHLELYNSPFHIPCAFVFHSIWMSRMHCLWELKLVVFVVRSCGKLSMLDYCKTYFMEIYWMGNRKKQCDLTYILSIMQYSKVGIFNLGGTMHVTGLETRRAIAIRSDYFCMFFLLTHWNWFIKWNRKRLDIIENIV
jgi:hypothetical protein